MAVSFIPNQPIRLRPVGSDTGCDCNGQPFCQLIQTTDQTQFEILSPTLVTNGNFTDDLTGWNVLLAITGTADITNESAIDACDGAVTITASGGTGPYTYSIDNGLTYQGSATFSNLCSGEYTVIIKDANNNKGTVNFSIVVNVDCGLYAGSEAFDLLAIEAATLLNCEAFDFT